MLWHVAFHLILLCLRQTRRIRNSLRQAANKQCASSPCSLFNVSNAARSKLNYDFSKKIFNTFRFHFSKSKTDLWMKFIYQVDIFSVYCRTSIELVWVFRTFYEYRSMAYSRGNRQTIEVVFRRYNLSSYRSSDVWHKAAETAPRSSHLHILLFRAYPLAAIDHATHLRSCQICCMILYPPSKFDQLCRPYRNEISTGQFRRYEYSRGHLRSSHLSVLLM